MRSSLFIGELEIVKVRRLVCLDVVIVVFILCRNGFLFLRWFLDDICDIYVVCDVFKIIFFLGSFGGVSGFFFGVFGFFFGLFRLDG